MAEFLTPDKFENIVFPTDRSPLSLCKISVDGDNSSFSNLSYYIDQRLGLVFDFVLRDGASLLFTEGDPSISLEIFDSQFKTPLILKSASTSDFTGAKVDATPQTIPIYVERKPGTIRVECLVVNGPSHHFKCREFNLSLDNIIVNIRQFEGAFEKHKNSKNFQYDSIPTGIISIESIDSGEIGKDDIVKTLSELSTFLTFVKGGYCSIGNGVGFDRDGLPSCYFLGFTKFDPFHLSGGWYDIGVSKDLEDLFRLYRLICKKSDESKEVIRNALEFYRASNVIRDSSIEMSIVSSHAALETIVPFILRSIGGWSSGLIDKRDIPFHDKMRASCSLIGLTSNPIEHSKKLISLSKARDGIDGFELVSLFRNRIVHQGKPFDYDGKHLDDIWRVSQWLIEIFIFFMIGYRGEMYDRRITGGWKGPQVPVPLRN